MAMGMAAGEMAAEIVGGSDGDGNGRWRDGRNGGWRDGRWDVIAMVMANVTVTGTAVEIDGDGNRRWDGTSIVTVGWHNRDWWRRNYNRFALCGGGYYYWNSGWWYPAYGYDPYFSTYAYDAPIYSYNGLAARPDSLAGADGASAARLLRC